MEYIRNNLQEILTTDVLAFLLWLSPHNTSMKQLAIKLSARLLYYILNISVLPRACMVLVRSLKSPHIRKGLSEVRALHRRGLKGDGAKYLHYLPWLLDNALRVVNLSLDRRLPCCILDLGSGPGYFMAMARAMGHEVLGIDIGEHPIYTPLNNAFGNPITWHNITPERPCAFQESRMLFDLITAFSVTFNRHGRSKVSPHWTPEDWIQFFSNLRPLLTNDGMVYLQLNTSTFFGCYGREFQIFRSGLLRDAGFSCGSIRHRSIVLFPV